MSDVRVVGHVGRLGACTYSRGAAVNEGAEHSLDALAGASGEEDVLRVGGNAAVALCAMSTRAACRVRERVSC